jgi:putative membrane protein insertion efficiency factor
VRPAELSTSELSNHAVNANEVGAARRSGISAAGQWLLLTFVQLYRIFLSPFLGGACKFYPSCSQYAQEAIALHGAKRGSVLALKRLGRCRPFTKGGFDPVPGSNLGYEKGTAPGDEALPLAGLVAASRDLHDYSDAEWLRTANKELAQ